MSKKSNHYVDNRQFLIDIEEYISQCVEAENSGNPIPKVPECIGRSIYDIANGLSKRPNFAGYSYRQDMVMDAVENSLKAIRNFDPAKSNNPFGYFTRISWFAFLRTIKKENRHETTKFNLIKHAIHASAITKDQYYDILKNKGFINKDLPEDEIRELIVFDEMAGLDEKEILQDVEIDDEISVD